MSRWAPTPWRSLTDAASTVVAGWRAVADDLEQHLGRVDRVVEAVGGLPQRHAHRVRGGDGRRPRGPSIQAVITGRRAGSAVGHRLGPRRRSHGGSPVAEHGRRQLAADVDLVAQVDPAVGVLVAEAGVAAELRRPHVVDLLAVVVVEGEELGGDPGRAAEQLVGDPVADELEEADLVDRLPQRSDEPVAPGAVQVAEIEHRDVAAHLRQASIASACGARRPVPLTSRRRREAVEVARQRRDARRRERGVHDRPAHHVRPGGEDRVELRRPGGERSDHARTPPRRAPAARPSPARTRRRRRRSCGSGRSPGPCRRGRRRRGGCTRAWSARRRWRRRPASCSSAGGQRRIAQWARTSLGARRRACRRTRRRARGERPTARPCAGSTTLPLELSSDERGDGHAVRQHDAGRADAALERCGVRAGAGADACPGAPARVRRGGRGPAAELGVRAVARSRRRRRGRTARRRARSAPRGAARGRSGTRGRARPARPSRRRRRRARRRCRPVRQTRVDAARPC